jgi:hypothetical protein
MPEGNNINNNIFGELIDALDQSNAPKFDREAHPSVDVSGAPESRGLTFAGDDPDTKTETEKSPQTLAESEPQQAAVPSEHEEDTTSPPNETSFAATEQNEELPTPEPETGEKKEPSATAMDHDTDEDKAGTTSSLSIFADLPDLPKPKPKKKDMGLISSTPASRILPGAFLLKEQIDYAESQSEDKKTD